MNLFSAIRKAGAHRAAVSLVAGVLAALAMLFFWSHALNLYRPALLLDINADIDFLRAPSSLIAFLFGYHNEHVVATTRVLSLADYVIFGSQYRLHQYASVILLVLMAVSLAILAVTSLRTHKVLDRAILAAFLFGVLLAPIMVPVVAFPYFVQHFIAGVLSLCISVIAWVLYRSASSVVWRICLSAAASAICLGLLTTSGHGIVLGVAALLAPILLSGSLDRRRAFGLAAMTIILVVAWRLWFSAAAGGIVIKLLTPNQWIGIADYYIRILSLSAHFASGGLRISIVFGALTLGVSVLALALAFRNRRQDGSLITSVAASLLIGHQLSIVLVAVGRAGSGWEAEDPKYAFYTIVIIASAALLIVRSLRGAKPLLAANLSMVVVLGIMLGSQQFTLTGSRQFYRTVEAYGHSLSLNLDDPSRRAMLGEDPQLWSRVDFANTQHLNIYMRRPGELLGHPLRGIAGSEQYCQGSLETKATIAARDGGVGIKMTGWLLDEASPNHKDLGIIIAQDNRVVGYGTFVSVRPDVHSQISSGVSRDAPVGWIAYARPQHSQARLDLYALDLKTLTACRSLNIDLPQLDPGTLAANAKFLQRSATGTPLTQAQRWSNIWKSQ